MKATLKTLLLATFSSLLLSSCSDNSTVTLENGSNSEDAGTSDWRTGSVNPSNAERIAASMMSANTTILTLVEFVEQLVTGSDSPDCSNGNMALSVSSNGVDSTDITSMSFDDCLVRSAGTSIRLDGSLKYLTKLNLSGQGRAAEIEVDAFKIAPMLEQANPMVTAVISYTVQDTEFDIRSAQMTFLDTNLVGFQNVILTLNNAGRADFSADFDGFEVKAPIATVEPYQKGSTWNCLLSGSFSLRAKDDSFVSVRGIAGDAVQFDLNGVKKTYPCTTP